MSTRQWVGSVAVAGLLGMGSISATEGGGPGLAATIPAEEIAVSGLISQIGLDDRKPRIVADGAGRICVLSIEGRTLRALVSADDGQTFSDVALDGTLEHPVLDFDARLSGGTLFLAMTYATAEHDIEARFARSGDLGQTWTDIVTVATDLSRPEIELAFGRDGFMLIKVGATVIASTDAGDHWGGAVPTGAGTDPRITIEPASNTVHLVARSAIVRSVDLGASFLPSFALTGSPAIYSTIAATGDGGILMAYSDESQSDYRMTVIRSSDLGETYSQVLTFGFAYRLREDPILVTHADSSTVLLGHADLDGDVYVYRSVDQGRTFEDPRQVASTAHTVVREDVRFLRTPAGAWLVAWLDRRATVEGPTVDGIYARSSIDGGANWGSERLLNAPESIITTYETFDLAAGGPNELLVAFGDAQAEPDGSDTDVYLARGPASTLDLLPSQRIDDDWSTGGPTGLQPPGTATDGAGRIYAAFAALDTPRDHRVYVSASSDRGRTWSPGPARARPSCGPPASTARPGRQARSWSGIPQTPMPTWPIPGRTTCRSSSCRTPGTRASRPVTRAMAARRFP